MLWHLETPGDPPRSSGFLKQHLGANHGCYHYYYTQQVAETAYLSFVRNAYIHMACGVYQWVCFNSAGCSQQTRAAKQFKCGTYSRLRAPPSECIN